MKKSDAYPDFTGERDEETLAHLPRSCLANLSQTGSGATDQDARGGATSRVHLYALHAAGVSTRVDASGYVRMEKLQGLVAPVAFLYLCDQFHRSAWLCVVGSRQSHSYSAVA